MMDALTKLLSEAPLDVDACGVPKQLEERVRQAVRDYQTLQKFLVEISELEWRRVKQRKEQNRFPTPARVCGKDLCSPPK